jgi:ferritin-like metal-binding protein YciE
LLQETLDEEVLADQKLNSIAKQIVNAQAAGAAELRRGGRACARGI